MKTFSVTRFFDPYGDGKSQRKVLGRDFYHTELSESAVRNIFDKRNKARGYYDEELLVFKPYKRTKLF